MISPYGYKPLLVIFILCFLVSFAIGYFLPGLWFFHILPFLFIIFSLNFFRNPSKPGETNEKYLYSPANGKVVEVLENVDENEYIKKKVYKITVFLNVFDVHVNTSPATGRVEIVKYVPGLKLNALDPRSSVENEYALVGLKTSVGISITVKQIAGLIARRIICDVKEGQDVLQNAVIGMIRFGSRAEICIPMDSGFSPIVKVGDKIKCGVTVLGEFN